MNNPLISVIVPVYNTDQYLRKCIESICNQTYTNLEIILIDDGSQDNSPAICDEFAQKDNRIKVIHKENGGVAAARNAGLDNATGDYIGFVDSDDFIEKSMYEKLLDASVKYGADLSLCNIHLADASGNLIDNTVVYTPEPVCIQTNTELLTALICAPNTKYVVLWNKLYKKNLLDCVRFPQNKINEDSYVIHHIYADCDRIACIPGFYYNYVMRPDSIMHVCKTVKNFDIIEVLLDRIQLLKQRGFESLSNKVLVQASSLLADLFLEITPRTKEVKSRASQLRKDLINCMEATDKTALSKSDRLKLNLLKVFPAYIFIKKMNRLRHRLDT